MQLGIRLLAAVALASGLGACATVTRGTTEEFTVNSTPPGAVAKTTIGFQCNATPCTFKMQRKDAFDVTVSKAGYKPQTVHVSSVGSGGGAAGLAGNVIAGGIMGMAIDATSGAMNDLSPNPLNVTLQSDEPAPAAAEAAPIPASTGATQ